MNSGRRRVSAALALVVFAGCSGGGDGDGEAGGSTAPAEVATTVASATTEAVATTTAAPTTIATTTTVAPVAVDTPCPNPISSRCGTVAVPLDRANPDAGTIDIYFEVVSHADTSQPTAGTLLALNGGPGPATLSSGPAGWSDLASDGYDLVLTDYRGTGRSAALHCATQDNGFPSEIQAARTTVQTCGEEIRDQAALYDTVATADDLEAVRTALGVGQLDVLGISYGTYVAQVFASRHPDAVRSVILDGAMPVGAPATGDGAHYSVPNLRAAAGGARDDVRPQQRRLLS